MKRLHLTALVLSLVCAGVAEAADPPKIAYTGDGSDLQAVIDAAPCLLLSPRFLRENG